MTNKKIAIVIPLANESETFDEFTNRLSDAINSLDSTLSVFMVVDKASKDNTLELCENMSRKDKRFITVWAPENRNVVDAYIRGYKEALYGDYNCDYVIEMDGGLSHDPSSLSMFVRNLQEGHDCVFGSRFINGGSIYDSNWKRTFLSRGGTILSNLLLGTKMKDMTSGYMGFHSDVAKLFVEYGLLSKAHFYQTEVRYLLRKHKCIEVPIHYMAPSPRVSKKAIYNSFDVLFYYFRKRISGQSISL